MTIWAIDPSALDAAVLALADPAALTEVRDRNGSALYAVEDGVASIPVRGVLLPGRVSGALGAFFDVTGYQSVTDAARAAVADRTVSTWGLDVDSPGGQVTGAYEAAAELRALAQVKPMFARARGTMASAAYWIASAAGSIEASPTARIGSLGAVLEMAAPGGKAIRVVSSQTPRKRMDPAAAGGLDDVQALVDDTAAVMLDQIASYRGTDAETLADRSGRGATMLASRALAAGLVDKVLTAATAAPTMTPGAARAQEAQMSDHAGTPAPDPRDESIAALITERQTATAEVARLTASLQAEQSMRAEALARLADAEAKLAAQAEKDRDASIAAMLARCESRGFPAPADRPVWEAHAREHGVEATEKLLLTFPVGAARPVERVASAAVDKPAEPRDQQDLAALAHEAVARKEFPGYSAAMSALQVKYPAAARVARAPKEV